MLEHWGYGGANPTDGWYSNIEPFYLGIQNGYIEPSMIFDLGAAAMSWGSAGMENGTWAIGTMLGAGRFYPTAGSNRRTGFSLHDKL